MIRAMINLLLLPFRLFFGLANGLIGLVFGILSLVWGLVSGIVSLTLFGLLIAAIAGWFRRRAC